MQLSEFFMRFTLHDSVVLQIALHAGEHKLAFLVELCNYDQPTFTSEQPQMVVRWLIFDGVRSLQSEPLLTNFHWGKGIDGEFVEVGEEISGRVKIVVKIDDYTAKTRKVLVLRADTTSVEWRELTETEQTQIERENLPLLLGPGWT